MTRRHGGERGNETGVKRKDLKDKFQRNADGSSIFCEKTTEKAQNFSIIGFRKDTVSFKLKFAFSFQKTKAT